MGSLADLLGLGQMSAQPDMMRPINDALAANALRAPQAAPQAAPQHAPSKLRNFLGALGDALLVGNGGQPLYQQKQDSDRVGSAIASFLGISDPTVVEALKSNPDVGLALYKMRNPEFLTDMRAAGIEPSSEEGRALTESHFGKQPSASIQDYNYAVANGYTGDFPSFVRDYLRPQMPITLGPNDTYQSAPSAPSAATVTSQQEYDALPPGTPYVFNGRQGIKGGATGKPSQSFPVNNPGALRAPGSLRFQSFSSPQEGIQAQQALLGRYYNRGLTTVSNIVETYAPRESAGGDNTDEQVNNYISYVARRLGVNAHDALAVTMLPRLGQAMREFETGRRVN